MPRASWKGFLRLSLVSCPVYLSPATTRAKSIRLHQVWAPRDHTQEPEADDADETPPAAERSRREPDAEEPVIGPATRIALRPHDPHTGEEVERDEVVKGYEYDRGQFVALAPDELKTLDVESTRAIDLATFVPRAEVDPVYFSTPYYIYPDGTVATETYRVIVTAMAETGMAGLGRLTLSRRERMVLVEPRGAGMLLMTLHAADEVRAEQFDEPGGEIDAEMVEIAATIIRRRAGHFNPATFRDRYQDALRELIEAKMRGLPVRAKAAPAPAPVQDLMTALKRSLANETGRQAAKPRRRAGSDRRQRNLFLPVVGTRGDRSKSSEVSGAATRRKKVSS